MIKVAKGGGGGFGTSDSFLTFLLTGKPNNPERIFLNTPTRLYVKVTTVKDLYLFLDE